MKLLAEARVKDGELTFKRRSVFVSDLSKLRDGDYIVTVERKKAKRSLMQNAYYWGVIVPYAKQGLNDIGYRMTTEATHEYLKGEFNIVEIPNERTGEILRSIGSTTEMSTSQMMEYFAKITEWAAEYLSIEIPQPGEQMRIEIDG